MKLRYITLLFCSSLLIAGEAQFLRYPVPSPDGSRICFSYQGDLWLVSTESGTASRLTVNPGYDFNPKWAPDGSRIAFVSDRETNDQIYSMKPDGTDLKQHTFYAGGNRLYSWRMDSKGLIFGSKRNDRYAWMPEVYMVTLEGKTPQKLFNFNAIDGACAPDQHIFYFVNGYDHKWRKHYKGAANNDIFSYEPAADKMTQYTTSEFNDLHPMPVKTGLYFVSDRDGIFNIYFKSFADGSLKKITDITDDGIRHAAISADGSTIAYTNNLDCFILKTSTGKSTQLHIQVNEDTPFTREEYKKFSDHLSDMKISPDEKEAVIAYHGELYAVKLDKDDTGRISRITQTAWDDEEPVWSKDGKIIYFISDREGQFDVYQVTPLENLPFYMNPYFKITRITDTPEDETSLELSPDGKALSYQRGNGDLILRNIETGTEHILLAGWNLGGYAWSPDSQFLAFSRSDNNFNEDIFIIPAKGGKEVNISRHPDMDMAPVWSPDGKMLSFSSRRYANNMEVLYTYLTERDSYKTREDWKLEKELEALKKAREKNDKETKNDDQPEKSKKGKKHKKADQAEKKDAVHVTIDFDNIHKRVVRLTHHLGDAVPVAITSKDSNIIYQLTSDGKTDLLIRDLDKKEPNMLTQKGSSPRAVQLREKSVYFLSKSGSIQSVNLKGKDKKSYKVRGEFSQKKSEETRQVFNQIWRIQNDTFYDPHFHGADWKAIREAYSKKVAATRSERDFTDLMNMLVGELNASHQRYVAPSSHHVGFGNLGAQLKPVDKGVEITAIMPKGPLMRIENPAQVGDIITKINRKPFQNIYQNLRDTVGKRVELTILRGDKQIHVWVRPLAHREVTGNLAYDAWIEQNRRKVHEMTDGKLGYVHIKGMSIPSLEVFETELFSEAEGRDALIIDVRYNGGGWTTDFLLNILTVAQHAYTIPRGGGKGYPQGRRTFYHWNKPIYVLCNEFSYSNAEIFSHAIKVLKRGTLIGTPTFGAVISTGGSGLLNGGFIRKPFRGWYVKGSGMNQENNGAVPDYVVPISPQDQLKGRDPQLDKAVELFNTGK
jgi:C-terminal processing protease CtpA/Prc